MIRRGETPLLDLKLGVRQVNEVRRGEEMVWRAGPGLSALWDGASRTLRYRATASSGYSYDPGTKTLDIE